MTRIASQKTYKRVLLKLSGEALSGDLGYGINPATLDFIANEVAKLVRHDIQIAIVVGGGNIFRGMNAGKNGIERTTADYMGMLATVMNALALQQGMVKQGLDARVQSAIPMSPVSEPYVRQRAVKHLEKGRVIIFAAGTGNPFFTTDTAACLRAIEVDAELLIKATKVDGIYDSDPITNKAAKRYSVISYDAVLEQKLGVMDATAIALCRENDLPLRVCSIKNKNSLLNIVKGADEGTLVTYEENE